MIYCSVCECWLTGCQDRDSWLAVDVLGAAMDHPDHLYMDSSEEQNAHCKRSCWQHLVTLIFFGNQQNKSQTKRRMSLEANVGEQRKDEKIQEWRSCEEEEMGSRGRTLLGLGSPGFLWIWWESLSISAGWNWVLFCNIPSGEVLPVLVLSHWRVMSVTTSMSGKCVKYS